MGRRFNLGAWKGAHHIGVCLLLGACSTDTPAAEPTPAAVDDLAPPTAIWTTVEDLRAGRDAFHDPSDGAGSAQLLLGEDEQATITVSTARTWTVEFTAGPLGIKEGGAVYLIPEPFWGWTQPQVHTPERLGFTSATTAGKGVQLEVSAGGGLFVATIRGRALEPGETVRLIYGEGFGALSDRHAEAAAHIWIAVDGDGDGTRLVLPDSPTIRVTAGAPAMLVAIAPTVVRPGEQGVLHLSILDALANRGVRAEGWFRISSPDGLLDIPTESRLLPKHEGVLQVPFKARGEGTSRLQVRFVSEDVTFETQANPILVSSSLPRVLWGDLHGHSGLSDGSGSPGDWFAYAREVAGLDLAALTDHDHWGVLFLDENPDLWAAIRAAVQEAHDPGHFVALPAYEWTSWIHGHRHVLFFADEGPLLSSLDSDYETPRQLWDGLQGLPAMTFAHHSSGSPVATNWSFAPDPVLEPLTEIASVHGSSEAADGPAAVRGSRRGQFVRDQLDAGVQLGFIASGDGHDGHPGLAHLSPLYGARQSPGTTPSPGSGGLAGIFSEEWTRGSILHAMRSRRTYATSGPRIYVLASLDQHPAGQSVPTTDNSVLRVSIIGTSPIKSVLIIRDGQLTELLRQPTQEPSFQGTFSLPGGSWEAGNYAYLRIEQVDGSWAWTSPWFGAP